MYGMYGVRIQCYICRLSRFKLCSLQRWEMLSRYFFLVSKPEIHLGYIHMYIRQIGVKVRDLAMKTVQTIRQPLTISVPLITLHTYVYTWILISNALDIIEPRFHWKTPIIVICCHTNITANSIIMKDIRWLLFTSLHFPKLYWA